MSKTVAEKIRIARLANSLSQQNMADELDLTVAAYSNIERGVTEISVKRLVRISEILGVSAIDLINDPAPKIFNEPTSNDYSSNVLSQQVYQLIKEIQSLTDRVDKLEKARPKK